MSRNSDDQDFFSRAMSDVRPIAKKANRVALKRAPDINHAARRQHASEEAAVEQDGLTGGHEHIEMLDPMDVLEFKRPGIQNGVYRNLRLGKYNIEARLDLHRHTVAMARAALIQFIRDCVSHDIRCAIITHGKGEGRDQPPIIKSCVAHWLPQLPEVQAFHSAQKQHGGTGATYIMLKKSERKRQEDLERHQKRRG